MSTPATLPEKEQALKESISTDDIDPGGVLPRDMFDEFYQAAVGEATLLDLIRTETVGAERTRIPRIGVGERQRRGQAEGAAGAEGDINVQHVDIDCKKGSVMWPLTTEVVENNPAGDELADTILDLMTRQFSADTQELAIIGDETADTGDPDFDDFARQNDGFLTLATAQGMNQYSHTNDAGDAQPINNELFSGMIAQMPDKYLNRGDPTFLMSMGQLQRYREFLSGNFDSAGFQVLMGDNDLTPFSYDVVGLPDWPEDQIMFTDPRNLIYALYREVEVEVLNQSDEIADKDLYAKYYLRTKDDFAIENAEAGVLGSGFTAP